jgi:UDP-glucuronate 4-epimerase
MSVLVTGATGHVGINVVRRFREVGHEVVGLDHRTPDGSLVQIFGCGADFVQGDVTDFDRLMDLVRSRHVEGIVHTAAMLGAACSKDPVRATHINVTGTQHVLEIARQAGLRRIVSVSSGSVFQRWPDPKRIIEEGDAPSPVSLYGTTKRMGELLVDCYRSSFNLSVCSVRMSWVYGPPLYATAFEADRGPIPYWLYQTLNGEPVCEASGGDFMANFTYVDDAAEGLLRLYDAELLGHSLYQLSTGEHYTVNDIMRSIRALIPGAELSIGPGAGAYASLTPMRGSFSIRRLQEDTAFVPQFPIDKGIAKYVDWLRGEIQRRGSNPA